MSFSSAEPCAAGSTARPPQQCPQTGASPGQLGCGFPGQRNTERPGWLVTGCAQARCSFLFVCCSSHHERSMATSPTNSSAGNGTFLPAMTRVQPDMTRYPPDMTRYHPTVTRYHPAVTRYHPAVTRLCYDVGQERLERWLDELVAESKSHVTTLLVLVCVVGTIGNLLVVLVSARRRKQSSATVCLTCLAAVDLLICGVFVPHKIFHIYHISYTGPVWCKLNPYFMTAGLLGSTFLLDAIAVDRYRAVCRPLRYCTTRKRRTVAGCEGAVLLGFALAVPGPGLAGLSLGTACLAASIFINCVVSHRKRRTVAGCAGAVLLGFALAVPGPGLAGLSLGTACLAASIFINCVVSHRKRRTVAGCAGAVLLGFALAVPGPGLAGLSLGTACLAASIFINCVVSHRKRRTVAGCAGAVLLGFALAVPNLLGPAELAGLPVGMACQTVSICLLREGAVHRQAYFVATAAIFFASVLMMVVLYAQVFKRVTASGRSIPGRSSIWAASAASVRPQPDDNTPDSTPDSTPCDSTPCDSTPCDSTPCDSTPCDSTVCDSTHCDSTPRDSTPWDNTPDSTPCESTPDSTPCDSTPDSTPCDSTPDSTPCDSTPSDSTPSDSTPSDSTPSDSTPCDSTPCDSTPSDSLPCDSNTKQSTTVSSRKSCNIVTSHRKSDIPLTSQPISDSPMTSPKYDSPMTSQPKSDSPMTSQPKSSNTLMPPQRSGGTLTQRRRSRAHSYTASVHGRRISFSIPRLVPPDRNDTISTFFTTQHQFRVAKLLMLVTMVFMLSWLPYWSLTLYMMTHPTWLGEQDHVTKKAVDFFQHFYLVNHALNPLIYAFVQRDFRSGLAAMVNGRVPGILRNRNRRTHSSNT
ncbi:hypothetical protein Bbelb_202950 [Branchiostoma belcheri]|nr:hypothetical protein Bbelb_202950 [Branchiostoma belcheri]